MSLRIPLSSPDITEVEIEAVTSVLRTNSLSLGPKLVEFEEAFAAFHGAPHAIAVSSGTAALHLAIRALNIGVGDEVILPSFTFIAVANAIRYEGATPVFADIDPITLNIDHVSVEAAITTRTRAILVVHTFGIPAEMNALMQIASRHRLAIIEDACEAIGSTYNDKLVGTFGDIAVFGFYPNKQITTGEGGAMLVRDTHLANRIRALRNQGRYPSGDWLQHAELGYNYRLSEIACALGIVQLRRLPTILAQRTRVASSYHDLLAHLDGILLPPLYLQSRTVSWFVYIVRLAEQSTSAERDKVLDALLQAGIGCARYFAPIHLQPAYQQLPAAQQARLPVTEAIAERTLALPFFNQLSFADAAQVADTLKAAMAAITADR
ncbi:DegT/DnrJ/EryC1/StrS family aminotransferase [Acidicapsa acidisoli]|uniref:DegT/DnrJ/EryC1/StrS family aminotransferase n=1 Tax=Acidicapsa acidisoli TaxID=1615681 RepID=UPI0021E06EB1|nr:DegT/DnrJ/EryC1/StrS family aminotransferase [Acidicapsa acidisoli]